MAEENTVNENENQIPRFSQEDVNRIVQGGVAKYSDYDELKTKATEVDAIREKYKVLNDNYTTGQEALKGVVDNMIGKMKEDKRGLIPDNFNLTDKIDYINKNEKILFGVEAQETPKVEDKQETPPEKPVIPTVPDKNKQTNASTEYGGYATPGEWARSKPKEYLAWRKKQ